MTTRKIQLNSRAAQRISLGYPWVFRSDCASADAMQEGMAGEVVLFCNMHDKILATGYAHPKTQLMGRVLARGEAVIDTAFFRQKFQAALDWRIAMFGDKPYYRLVHAESDSLPGLIVDRFGDTLVAQSNSAGMEALQGLWLPALQQVTQAKNIILKNDSTGRVLEGLPETLEVPAGTMPDNHLIPLLENDTQFFADVKEGQKTGWFFDQRPHRLWIADKAQDKTVIDVFSHTGGFGITAARHGAAHVTCVDSSQAALALAQINARQNDVAEKCSFIVGKAFDVLENLKDKDFDIVCVDPPAFVKTKKDMVTGLKGYEKLARLAAPLVAKGGILFYASCSSHPTENDVLQAIFTGIAKAGRNGALVYNGTAGPDHPVHSQLPETRYLKAFGFRVA